MSAYLTQVGSRDHARFRRTRGPVPDHGGAMFGSEKKKRMLSEMFNMQRREKLLGILTVIAYIVIVFGAIIHIVRKM